MEHAPSTPSACAGSSVDNTVASADTRATATQGSMATPRVALVTGAGKRLGRAIALALAQDGWDIGVHCRDSVAEAKQTVTDIQALGRRAVVLQADLDDAGQCQTLVPRLADSLGPVSGLVNSASRFEYDDIRSFTPESLQQHLVPNLMAPLLLAQSLASQLPAAPVQGIIVNLLDQKLFNLNPDFLSYTLSKAALSAATTMLAQALAPRMRVVGVAPGLTLPSYLQDDAAFARAHRTLSPLGASSTARDVADTVVFAMKTRSITGTTLLVDGGQHLLGLPRDASLMDGTPPTGR
ncbi:SDR family oxidoreductase [Lautropia mirabilis]|uniref:SDR family oxidoreductase n=1 Tax=Lautropia mirabilis TaxID=47671 RepID=UPI0028D54C00|nr:SDR family oxidoreductase [Lautropia mirabilis]